MLVANSSSHRSTDGGVTFQPWGGCGDCHDIWFDPTNADRFAMTDDGGMQITTNHGQTISSASGCRSARCITSPSTTRCRTTSTATCRTTGRCAARATSPEAVANNAARAPVGPAGGRGGGGGGRGGAAVPWDHALGGCESGFTIPDPTNPDIVWASCYGNKLTRYDAKQGTARSVAPWMISLDSPPTDTKYRCHWTAPLAVDPFDTKTAYYGCQVIFATSNGGQSWKVISPDLSTKDPSRIIPSGGIVGDNLGQFYGEVVFAIAPSPVQRGLIWAGTNDGKVWNTRDGGANWTDVTKNITGLPAWSVVSKIDPSNFDAGHGVRRRRRPPHRRPRAAALQDDRLRRDVEERVRRPAVEAPARLHAVDRREPEPERHALRGHRARLLLLARRRRELDARCRTACRPRR